MKNRKMITTLLLAMGCMTVSVPNLKAAAEPVTDRELTAVSWIKPKGEPLPVNTFGEFIHAVAFSADGKQIIADTDKTLFTADLSLKKAAPLAEGYRDMLDRPVFGPAAKRIYLASWNTTIVTEKGKKKMVGTGELKSVDRAALNKVKLTSLKKEAESNAISADGAKIALGYGDGTFQILDTAKGKSLLGPVKAYKGVTVAGNTFANVAAIAFSSDGKRLALGDVEAKLRFYDAATGKALGAPVMGHTSLIEVIAFSPDGRYIVTATQDKGLFLLDGATGTVIGDRLETGNKVTSLAFSPDGKQIVTGHFHGDVRLWDFVGVK